MNKNPKTFQFLSRIGMIAYLKAEIKKVKKIRFILASQARRRFGIKKEHGESSIKNSVARWLYDNIELTVDDDDIADALVLALYGSLSEKGLF